MKKVGNFLLMVLAFTMFFSIAGCKSAVEEHVHTFANSWTSDAKYHWHTATCEHSTEISGKEAHKWDEGDITVDPTEEDKGEKTYKCKICGFIKTEEIPPIGHIHVEDEGTETKKATYTTKGEMVYKCTGCSAVLRTEVIPELYSVPVDAETGKAATATSKYVYFGIFPKTVLPSGSSVTVNKSEKISIGANNYYKGSDNEWYAEALENAYDSSYKYSDNSEVQKKTEETTSYRYFKVEPIKWKVLTADYNGTEKALLLAEDILSGNVTYYIDISNRTIGGSTIYPNNYKYSTIRAYLNGAYESGDEQTKTYNGKGFLQTAFITSAQEFIVETEVNNSKETTGYSESTYAENICDNTSDKIFLLSESEVTNNNYGFPAYNSEGNGNVRIRVPTDYAKANYVRQAGMGENSGSWWLRSPFKTTIHQVWYVYGNGNAASSSDFRSFGYGVVPALCIPLNTNN